ncbi:dihydrolipoamide acetyltransferase family protein [Halostagnicola kamekurae]|uniref:Pyruvate dehydrogenase E2 component (Dihydrolipoamide acetyltransferase) n=1 Tax=Halostagnicola kamekurae TaxID=619731 RepID=A0A1I6NWS4_9EURY|nr:dihydrolipoamide acetyltransferase family protein [Halostagnicola kamekurae]SFS32354.1 pyruvate dehydrogenase E2 component (dihydrolipoamide acetyltransferase) [Halostagnicola kamekurae]
MAREFKLPDVGEGVAEGELVSWLVEEGDPISEDQPVAEVETDKALVEVPSPVDGSVRELRAEEGEIVPVGDVIITFDVEGEESSETARDAEDDDSAAETTGHEADSASVSASGDEPAGDPGATGGDIEEIATPEGRVFAPPRVRRMAREAGVDIESVQGSGPGGRITDGDVRAAAGERSDSDASDGSSDSSDDESASSADASSGAEPNADSGGESDTADSSAIADAAGETATPQEFAESADRERTLAAPATRRLAEEEGIDIDTVPTDETRDGEPFVTPEAVTEYATMQREAQEADAAAVSSTEATADSFEGERERREPFKGVRKAIADAMVESKYSAPHVTHHDEVDVTELVELRERLKPRAAEEGIKLTYMPFITKAVVAALEEFPEMNAVIDEENEEIVYRNYYNIGVATATDVGLMVPVVDDADEKGLLQIASETNELVQKARERSISPDELQGSTFTITNVGGIGGEYATPILNYPETGILAIGEIKRKPRVVTDEDGTESIEPRSVMTLSLSFDHRLIDGAVGARFTNALMEYLEDPELLLLQ